MWWVGHSDNERTAASPGSICRQSCYSPWVQFKVVMAIHVSCRGTNYVTTFAQESCKRLCPPVHGGRIWIGRAHRHCLSSPGPCWPCHDRKDEYGYFNYMVDIFFVPGSDGFMFCSLAKSSTTRNVLPLVGARTNSGLRASFRSTYFMRKKTLKDP